MIQRLPTGPQKEQHTARYEEAYRRSHERTLIPLIFLSFGSQAMRCMLPRCDGTRLCLRECLRSLIDALNFQPFIFRDMALSGSKVLSFASDLYARPGGSSLQGSGPRSYILKARMLAWLKTERNCKQHFNTTWHLLCPSIRRPMLSHATHKTHNCCSQLIENDPYCTRSDPPSVPVPGAYGMGYRAL